jgi:hypothetical protein
MTSASQKKLLTKWEALGTVATADMVDTAVPEAMAWYGDCATPFHLTYYDLDLKAGNLAAVAEFVNAGLPPSLRFERDEAFCRYCNWPAALGEAGEMAIFETLETAGGSSGEQLQALLETWWPHLAERAKLQRRDLRALIELWPWYLPEAIFDDEQGCHYWLPLNVDTALRLVRRDQARFRRAFAGLLLGANRLELTHSLRARKMDDDAVKRYQSGMKDLIAVTNRIIALRFTVGFGKALKLEISAKPALTRLLECVPNSVTWAWDRLLNSVVANRSYARCARPSCNRLFEQSKESQRYCSEGCASADRQRRYRERHSSDPQASDGRSELDSA